MPVRTQDDVACAGMIIIQPTSFCNLDCDYCYVPGRTERSHIQMSTISTIVERLIEWNRFQSNLIVLWHAGEPLAMPVSFYEKAFAAFERLDAIVPLKHAMQTNGTMITDDHCALFRAWDVSVGVSIDGPKRLHDGRRKYRSGRGSFENAARGIRVLQTHGLVPTAIAVLEANSIIDAEEFYGVYRQLGIEFVGLNVDEAHALSQRSSFDKSPEKQSRFRAFLTALFKLSLTDKNVVFREFLDVVGAIFWGRFPITNSDTLCGHIISFNRQGEMSTFSPEFLGIVTKRYGAFTFGDVFSTSIHAALQSARSSAVGTSIRNGLNKCMQECSYFGLCGGGNPSAKLGQFGRCDVSETTQCVYMRQITCQVILETLKDPRFRRLAIEQYIRSISKRSELLNRLSDESDPLLSDARPSIPRAVQ